MYDMKDGRECPAAAALRGNLGKLPPPAKTTTSNGLCTIRVWALPIPSSTARVLQESQALLRQTQTAASGDSGEPRTRKPPPVTCLPLSACYPSVRSCLLRTVLAGKLPGSVRGASEAVAMQRAVADCK